MSYLDTLREQRTHAAKMCDTIATRMLLEGQHNNRDALDTMHMWSQQRDALDQQIAWMNRRTGWAWPKEPAWCN
jgi:hypothetical protein